MPKDKLNFLALDLGAESGRAMLGQFDGQRLQLAAVHRFANGPVCLPSGLHWDVLRLWSEITYGIALAAQECQGKLSSVGLDTWGVDFGLLDRSGALLGNPTHYRDSRTDGMVDEAFRRVGREEIFQHTGIQFMQLNSLYQLLSMVVGESPLLEIAQTFLTMPDLFNYWLTGRKVCEFSIATTTQCYDPRLPPPGGGGVRGGWARSLLEKLGIPTRIFPEIVPPGTVLGDLLPQVAEEVGARIPVIAPACHDTGSAVAAVPATGGDFAYISSGTWSLMGAELAEPVINADSLAYNFTNEGGVGGKFRFLKNIMGLWLVQESRRTWANQGETLSYDELTQMAAEAQPLRAIVNPDDGDFLKPGDMPARIRAFCQRTGQPAPESKGAIVRCALESLALKYRWTLERLEEMLGRRLEPIHIIGGGTQNRLLNQLAADATGRRVVTGPIEATAIGNVLVQMMALGHIASLAEGRQIVCDSFDVEAYEPHGGNAWDEAYERFLKVTG
ncbi:MAG: rhamnulokinase [Anaerolineae bacterium]|nr:rhamnulokinase [Anaerolineae bacterium]